jgi:hydrogenase maturation protease
VRPILILGIGNILLRDEGVGVRVVEAMAKIKLPPQVEILDGGTGGADLVDVVANRDKVIVVDAMNADSPPGTVYRMAPDDLLEEREASVSLHEIGLMETLHMARLLDCSPGEVVIFGVQPKEVRFDVSLTKEIEDVIPKVIRLILAELDSVT